MNCLEKPGVMRKYVVVDFQENIPSLLGHRELEDQMQIIIMSANAFHYSLKNTFSESSLIEPKL